MSRCSSAFSAGGEVPAALAVVGVAALLRGLRALRRTHDEGACRRSRSRSASSAAAAILIAPLGFGAAPGRRPSAKTIAAVVALGALGTGFAYLLYFEMIASAGASRAILVTYLVPAFALVYGAVFLDERSPPRRSAAWR